jgi:hypothetical protein
MFGNGPENNVSIVTGARKDIAYIVSKAFGSRL